MDQISTIVLAIVLITIMFGMGLSLSTNDFKNVLRQPKAVAVGLLNQIVILPIIAYFIVTTLNVAPDVAVGIMLLAACPGGTTSNIIAHLAKGDTALSVSLTALSSIIAIVTIPQIVSFALDTFVAVDDKIEVNKLQMIAQLLVIVIIPVAIGMFIKARSPQFAQKMDPYVRRISTILLVVVTLALVFKDRANIIPYFAQAGISAIILNVSTLFIGFLSAYLLKLSRAKAISISIESGIQNSALAMTIATVTLQNSAYIMAPGIYTLIMYISGFMMIYLGQRLAVSKESL